MTAPTLTAGLLANTYEVRGEPRDALRSRYVRATSETLGAVPLLVPVVEWRDRTPEFRRVALESYLRGVDMVVLTGDESNVHPKNYGLMATRTGPWDEDRDALALDLIAATRRTRTPLLGICRGLQEINVAFGGTLTQDLRHTSGPVRHHEDLALTRDQQYGPAHDVHLREGHLRTWLGKDRMTVNSLHTQSIDKLGRGLRTEAVAPDGVIESVSSLDDNHLLLGVQWHPEWHARTDRDAASVLAGFADAVRSRKENRP